MNRMHGMQTVMLSFLAAPPSQAVCVSPTAAHLSPRWQFARSRPPTSLSLQPEELAPVLAAAALAAAAGSLQYKLSSGEKGLNAFLMKEVCGTTRHNGCTFCEHCLTPCTQKKDNPFYSRGYVADKPSTPSWFTWRLPKLDFVEVYGQESSQPSQSDSLRPELASLYMELDDAIDREDYTKAKEIKARIDSECES